MHHGAACVVWLACCLAPGERAAAQPDGPAHEVRVAWLRDNAELRAEEEEEISSRVKKLLNDSLAQAEDSPLPDPATLMEGVYATPEDLDTPHHK